MSKKTRKTLSALNPLIAMPDMTPDGTCSGCSASYR